ncbi:CobW family GTP-binding protein [Marinibacterium profundimaris]|uniref:CobW C-terminal domain-containing protein n=1 Tax=Marinibacterium profundimaris TaxID=1679460 RepID=A0A225NS65_9RHOB|nr:GTP-binding protein [Marinibacterium profundimaris]OWU77692.1 hypothetical protein ATO3_03175 [Marinibacterium profundimaris]
MTAEPGADRLKLVIVGGYLGAGKSTWLRHQLYAGAFPNAHLIINEAAELAVDDAIFGARYPLTLLSGGCACCEGQAAFLTSLRQLCDDRSRAAGPQGRTSIAVLETSGLADPAAIAASLRADPMLAFHLALSEIIVLVDARNAAAQLSADPLGRAQIEAADRLVITKSDLAPPSDTARLVATLQRLNPGATITAETRGEPVPLPDATGADPLPLADHATAPIRPVQIDLPKGLDWASFAVWLSALLAAHGDDIVRVKGTVRTPAGRLLLQGIRDHVQPPEILPDSDMARDGTIVLIGREIDADRVTRSLTRFAGDLL